MGGIGDSFNKSMMSSALIIPQENRIKIVDNFFLDELLHPDIYFAVKDPMRFLDMRVVLGMQFVRDKAKTPFTVNNWATGGKREFSGMRPMHTTKGALFSMHKFCRAYDIICKGGPDLLHQIIKDNQGELIQSERITRVENISHAPTWTHIDNAWTGMDSVYFFNP